MKKLVIMMLLALIVFTLTACGGNEPVPDITADIDVNKMFAIMAEESMQRLEGTPLKALTMLGGPLQDGSTTVEFSADMFGMDVSGMLSLHSNINDSNFALMADVLIPFMGNFDLSVFLNDERIALQTNILDEYFYGIRFSTFEQDFQTFASAANLDPFIIEDVMMFLEELESALVALELASVQYTYDVGDLDYLTPYFEPFADLFREYFDSLELRRAEVTFGEKNIDAIRYSYTLHFEGMVAFFEDFTDLLENLDVEGLIRETFYVFSEQIEAQGETITEQMIDEAIWEALELQRELVRDTRRDIEEMRQEFEGYRVIPTILYIYLDNSGRLLQIFIVSEDEVEVTLNFGTSVYDPWFFEIVTFENWEDDPIDFRVDWKFESVNNVTINRISVDGGGLGGIGAASAVSEWNQNTGDFVKSMEMGGWQLGSIEGNFTVQGGGFELSLSDIEIDGILISLDITTALGANIPEIDFINMDRWDGALMDRVEEAMFAFMMNFMF